MPVEHAELAAEGVKLVGHVTGPSEHILVVLRVADELSQQMIAAGVVLETVDLNEATLALFLALLKLTNTIEAKIPIIAITIKSSIRVKPFFFLVVFFFFIFHPPFYFINFYFLLKIPWVTYLPMDNQYRRRCIR